MGLPATKPWHTALVVLAEQVARGVKPLASMPVSDADPGEVDLWMREWNKDRPAYARKILWKVSHDFSVGQPIMLYMFYDELSWDIYCEGYQLPAGPLRHALMGFLFGYDFDDIIHFIKYRDTEETK